MDEKRREATRERVIIVVQVTVPVALMWALYELVPIFGEWMRSQ